MKHITVAIDWYGPYSFHEALDASRDFSSGLYMGIGKAKYQRGRSCLQYIGLGKKLSTRLKTTEKIHEINREMVLWLGEVGSFGIPGRKRKQPIFFLI